MGYRKDEFSVDEIYHVFSRGVEKRPIFRHDRDRKRFVKLQRHCLPQGIIPSFSIAQRLNVESSLTAEGEGLADVLCYCLMDNHIHLLLKENVEGGISAFMQRLLTSYARYFNISTERSGSLFTNPFKNVLVDTDEQLLHVSRYIHLNPLVAGMVKNAYEYLWSSLGAYTSRPNQYTSCHSQIIRDLMSQQEYRSFLKDAKDYKHSLERFDHLLLDNDS